MHAQTQHTHPSTCQENVLQTLILPFHSQGRFGSAIHHNSKSRFQLGRCNCINVFGRMEVRKQGPYDAFLATQVQMWRKNITSESRSTYKTGSLHYFPVKQTAITNTLLPVIILSSSTCFSSDANICKSWSTFPQYNH